jgi:DNA-directed RNA polymerase subunit alpha
LYLLCSSPNGGVTKKMENENEKFTEISLSSSELEELLREKFTIKAGFNLKEVLTTTDSKSFIFTFEKVDEASIVDPATVADDAFLDSYLKDLDIDSRTMNRLKREGFITVRELLEISYTDLLKIRYLGKKSLKKLNDFLREHGLSLKDYPAG